MKLIRVVTFIFCLTSASYGQSGLDKKKYYSALSDSSLITLNSVEKHITQTNAEPAYLGALQMKKAGLINDPGQKIKLFRTGREHLELAIKNDSNRAEWRFLRLIIQENSPKIMRYNQQIQEDASYLRSNYSKLDTQAQNALYLYFKTSHVLKEKDFKKLKHE